VIARDEPVERPAAMAGDNPEFRVPVKDIAVGQALHGSVLFGHEGDLIVSAGPRGSADRASLVP